MDKAERFEIGDLVRFSPKEDTPGQRLLDSFGNPLMVVIYVSSGGLVHTKLVNYESATTHAQNYNRGHFAFCDFRFMKDAFMTAVRKRRHQ